MSSCTQTRVLTDNKNYMARFLSVVGVWAILRNKSRILFIYSKFIDERILPNYSKTFL